MNRKKVKVYIDKINMLHNNILSDEDFSEMEIELLKNYTKLLYESLAEGQSLESKPAEIVEEKVATITGDPHNEDNQNGHVNSPSVIPAKKVEPIISAPPKVQVEESIADVSVTQIEPEQIAEEQEETSVVEEPKIAINPDLEALFEIKEAKELSDRLGMLPIKDIVGAMSINEKIFTTQELFNGDKDLMKSTLSKLNDFKSFGEAKQFLLSGVASQNDWSSDGKVKKALHFIQLVKRRYS